MATLRKRRKLWYARVRWYEKNDPYQTEKMIPLRTPSKVEAMERLSQVNKYETDIKSGVVFAFPWLTDSTQTTVKRFTLSDAVKHYVEHRNKLKLRPKTLELNNQSLDYFIRCVGANRPFETINTDHVSAWIDYLKSRRLSVSSINIHLRTINTMFRYYHKVGILNTVPIIDQRRVDKKEPNYITDDEFQSIIELDLLDEYYKRVFYFYRETGFRLQEPFISNLDGKWLDIPNLSKGKKPRSIELDKSLVQIYMELMDWYRNCGLVEESKGRHISKMFKKALRARTIKPGARFSITLENALAASACASELDVDPLLIKKGLENSITEKGRLNLIKCNDFTILDDSYNANPQSMKVAIDALLNFKGKKIAVLGSMAELGNSSEQLHQEVGDYARQADLDFIFSVGQDAKYYQGQNFPDIESLYRHLRSHHLGATILIKGSRMMKLDRLVDIIQKQ